MKLAVYQYGSKTYFNLPEPTLMHKETVLKYRHLKGQEITEKELKAIKNDNLYYHIFDQALKKLSFKPYTKKKLKEALKGEAHIIDQVLHECETLGYINDASLLEIYIDDFKHLDMSKRAFENKMIEKGFSKTLLQESLFSLDIDEVSRAHNEALKVVKTYKLLPWLKVKEKLTQFLVRKGYNYSDIDLVLKEIKKDFEVDEETLLRKELKKEKNIKDIQKLRMKYLRKGYHASTIQTVLKEGFHERD